MVYFVVVISLRATGVPNRLRLRSPVLATLHINKRVTLIAENNDSKTPMPSVSAKPLTGPVPKKNNTVAAIKVVTCESKIAVHARLNAARSLTSQDPKRVAQVVKNWVASDG